MTRSAGSHGGSAGRVIAGSARGIRLAGGGPATRPLGDRVKQSLFAILEPDLRGRPFLDLYAGSGAAGIEALSRGAARATFVDRDRVALAAIRANLAATRLTDAAEVAATAVGPWLARAARPAGGYGAIVVDPPYEHESALRLALEAVAAAGPGGILAADGALVAKHSRRAGPAARIGLLRSARVERFGETTLTFYRWAAADEGGEDA